ncbi:ribonuclease P protein component 3 [Methanolobus sp. WCC5]|uniref:ribonuclease P protein component 3 n=1 Tax=Methanolobus sp. WCC5 TaxID=3125785 RepID=UPI00324DF2A8
MASLDFYDLNVYSLPEGKNTVEEMAVLASRFGYAGIAITNPFDSFDSTKGTVFQGIELFSAVEINVDNASRLHGLVGKYRNLADVIVVRGGNENINRAAVENPNVDVLANFGSMKDNGLNHILARSANDNDVAISFDLAELIGQRGGRRVRALSNFRKDLELARKYDVPFILTANARSVFDLRAPRELIALAGLFGMTREEALKGISSTPKRIISKNRHSSDHVFDGVKIVDSPVDIVLEGGGGQ